MSTFQKFGTMTIGLAALTTAILPGRQTAPVINAVRQLITGTLGTAMGTAARAKP